MLIDDLMRRLYADLQIEGEKEGEEYLLHFEDELNVRLCEGENGIELRATPGIVPPGESNEQLFLKLLLANLFGQGTGGATLSLDSSGTKVLLTRFLPKNITYVQFREEVELFLNYLTYWIKALPSIRGT